MNPLQALATYGQSVWLDYIRRNLITSRELEQMVHDDGLRGVTSNPAIFEKAITGSTDYADSLQDLWQHGLDPKATYEAIAIRDVQDAADMLRPVYDSSNRRDGYISLEVSPYLARDANGTMEEARRLWSSVNRPNLMVKVPATREGLGAIQGLISEGINVNVTLLFSKERYEQVAKAYIDGLTAFAAGNSDVGRVASVASFFISRIDTAMDTMIAARMKSAATAGERAQLGSLLGKVAIANAKMTYISYKDIFGSAAWKDLAAKGAQTQRLLWASTGTKNPAYRDVIYVEELIGQDTVNTMPPATLEAFRDHGKPRASLEEDIESAQDAMETVDHLGLPFADVTQTLLVDGLKLFADAFDKLLGAVDRVCTRTKVTRAGNQHVCLPGGLSSAVKDAIADWQNNGKVRRLWARDSSLWTGSDESSWLGWLAITEGQLAHKHHLTDFAAEVNAAGFTDALLLGMGGSSLCPEVWKMTFGKVEGYPELHVLDSTDPAQVRAIENKVDLSKTLCIVASKSGSTLEPNLFHQYFFDRVKQAVGEDRVGSHFVAITDPGSKMQQVAESDGFRRIFYGVPSIGGRYSALSDFGMVPAAVMGLDPLKLLDRAEEMVHACRSCVAAEDNPGVALGAMLGVAANAGRDKVTLICSPALWDLGAWLEQLLAESTGKEGKGLIPVDREPLGPPEVYGSDRVFAYIRYTQAPDAAQDAAIDAVEHAGHPVVRIHVEDLYDLPQEFFRWEIATAVAGSILGINAFNQPDVEASKIATRKLTSEYEKTGSLPSEEPILEDESFQLYTDSKNALALTTVTGRTAVEDYLRAHINRLGAGDYFALLAYIEMNDAHEQALQAIRKHIRDSKRVATCLGFGPRFLHSTGQAYKGGPNSGVFLQITCDDNPDLAVPGQRYTFGVVKAAQARGDFQVLADRDRRALRVHIKGDLNQGLARLGDLLTQH